jgi:hypothetical protein
VSGQGDPADVSSRGAGSTTGPSGTPIAVDVSRDRRARIIWVVFLAGPVTWFAHFMLVYLVVEAGCTGDGPGLVLFDPPVPTVVTLAATAVAAVVCLWCAWWGYRRWQASQDGPELDVSRGQSGDPEHSDRSGTLAFAGLLLSLLSFVAILLEGLPALVLPAC